MNLEKVVFGFFVLLAATLNFGYVIGDISNPHMHNHYELYAALAINIIATILKFGDRTQIGAVHLATSLVATIQLLAATVLWIYSSHGIDTATMSSDAMSSVVSIAAGALLANIVSIVLLVVETVSYRRR